MNYLQTRVNIISDLRNKQTRVQSELVVPVYGKREKGPPTEPSTYHRCCHRYLSTNPPCGGIF